MICDDRFASHARLGIQAAALLPEWEKQLLQIPPAGAELALLPRCDSALEQLAFDCLLMDWLYDDRFRYLALQENGMLLPHMMPDFNGQGAYFSGHPVHPGKCFEIVKYLLGNAAAELERGDIPEFCRRAGILGHFLQDLTAPNHNISSEILRQLFPDPVKDRVSGFKFCYEIAPDLGGKSPEIMGNSLERAAFFITDRALKYACRSREFLPELVKAGYLRDQVRCRDILRVPARWAVELTACAWHTVFALVFDRMDGGEFPDSIPLSQLFCAYHHPDIYKYAPGDCFCFDGSCTPLKLIGEAEGKCGIALTGHSGMKYFTGGIFSGIRFTVGLADHPSSYDEHIDLDFSVETDDRWCEQVSEDMEYGCFRRAGRRITGSMECQRMDVDISGAHTLVFASKAAPYTDSRGVVSFAIPHIGITEPVLYFKHKKNNNRSPAGRESGDRRNHQRH